MFSMEPYNGKDFAMWKTIESSSSSGGDSSEDESDDDDGDKKKVPKGYYKKKIPIKKIFSTTLVEEDLIPE